ncbi:phage terminase large subunit [Kingella negevensis]|uniref:phage terminase large subunit n=1 Tax=Kingella negevensis TaxID=1522312 RepID=UPI002542A095|nr:phage terminase large subunit [Kingella negevensis]WII93179.1 phage terminase large subunit [Kingella negevensis]
MKIKEFLKSLATLADQFRRTIEAEVVGFDDCPAAVAERRAKVFDPISGYQYFANTYFPHYVRSPEKSQLHEYLFFRLPEIISSEKSEIEATAAPRGEAKSTMVTQLFSLWCLVTGKKHYIVIVMDSIDQAYPMLEAIKAELQFNPRLQTDFPEACGTGRVWQAGTIVTANDAKVQVAGSSKKLRGLRHGAYRPDLCVLDDIENDEQVRNPAQRDKLHSWLTKTVLPLGGVGQKYDVVYIGTILHYDSVLNRTLNNPFWHSQKFKAMLQFPERMDLWEHWENLYLQDGETVAQAYYEQHREDMERGAKTSWAARGVLALMKIRARDGHSTFDSEYQNDPISSESAIFANYLSGCLYTAKDLPNDLDVFGAIDPATGTTGGDYSAVIIAGRSRSTGKLFVLETVVKRMLPDALIESVIALQRQYRCLKWAVETVQFQAFLKTELVQRGARAGVPIPAVGVKSNANKQLRIETLQPHFANGMIWLKNDQKLLIEQLRHFPKADHDDAPDALQMVWAISFRGAGQIKPLALDSFARNDCPY